MHNWDTHSIDWFFYCKGDLKCGYDTEKVETLSAEYMSDEKPTDDVYEGKRQAGYQHLFDIAKFETDDDWTVNFELPDKTIKVSMKGEPGTTVFMVNSYTANTETTRRGLVIRRQAEKTTFRTVYECIKK